ncbi:MAG: hypothetical protein OXI81_07270 [Paracoccaceae bacterium]|nr:hypothetical protein [Paracoccaceae bacterium]
MCGGPYSKRGQDRYGCSNHVMSGAMERQELAAIEKKIKAMVAVIEDGGHARGMMYRMRELEARQDELNERLAAVPADIPDILPNIAIVYRRKVERLAEALANPRDRDEAAYVIPGAIERIVLTPRREARPDGHRTARRPRYHPRMGRQR